MIFAESDWLGSFCCWGFVILMVFVIGIGQAVKGIGTAAGKVIDVATNAAKNETVQEAGTIIGLAWLEDWLNGE